MGSPQRAFFIYACMHICIYIYIYIYIYITCRSPAGRSSRSRWHSLCWLGPPRICVYIYIYLYMCVCIYLYLSFYIYIYIYIQHISPSLSLYIYIYTPRTTGARLASRSASRCKTPRTGCWRWSSGCRRASCRTSDPCWTSSPSTPCCPSGAYLYIYIYISLSLYLSLSLSIYI